MSRFPSRDEQMAAGDDARHAKDAVDAAVSELERIKREYGTGYDIAQSAQSYRKALDQAIKWAKQARSAM